jgi:hypothetical protein
MCKIADNNIIYHNSIINSTGQQSFDMHNNKWYSSSLQQGNYWSDYNGFDNNNDNIGDTPYSIYGGESKDLYPLMKPYTKSLYKKNTTSSEEICILIFYSPLCGPCEENLEYIESLSNNYSLKIEKHNILKEDELALLNQYFEAYKISEENHDTFCVFISDKYFHTEEEINTGLEQEIKKHIEAGCDCPIISGDNSNNSDESYDMLLVIIIIAVLIIVIIFVYYLKRNNISK